MNELPVRTLVDRFAALNLVLVTRRDAYSRDRTTDEAGTRHEYAVHPANGRTDPPAFFDERASLTEHLLMEEAIAAKRRLWRTFVRVESLEENSESVLVVVPGWDLHVRRLLPKSDLPASVLEAIEQGQTRFHAHVNIGADEASDLVFRLWEIGPA